MKRLAVILFLSLMLISTGCGGGPGTKAQKCLAAVSSLYQGAIPAWFATTKGENANQMLAWCFNAECMDTLNKWIEQGVVNSPYLLAIREFCGGCKGDEDWPDITKVELRGYDSLYFDDWCEHIRKIRRGVNFPYL